MARSLKPLLAAEGSLPILGTINAFSALLAEKAGARAIYLSGAGVANAAFGMPDLAVTNLQDVLSEASRITDATELPLLVDVDTGFGQALGIARTVRLMERAEVAAIHIEDQQIFKRCGHRPNKALVSSTEMMDRLKAAVDARHSPDFQIMARTDAYAKEGLNAAIERALQYIEAGADLIFMEALQSLEEYREAAVRLPVPILANITEFGKTPLFTQQQLAEVGVKLVLYPLSAFRAMAKSALQVYSSILQQGSQQSLLPLMQTRKELYEILDYEAYERAMDAYLGGKDDNC